MSYYITLEGKKFGISELPKKDQDIYLQVCKFLGQIPKPGWSDFANFWTGLVMDLHVKTSDVTETPIYKIFQDMECRLGIEEGIIKPLEDREYQNILFDLSEILSDKGNLLITFSAANMVEFKIDRSDIDCFVSILKDKDILPFSYSFRHDPCPYSPLLHEELFDLKSRGYIEMASPISITTTGNNWVNEEASKHPQINKAREKAAQEIGWIVSFIGNDVDKHALFELCYATITRF